MIAYLLGIMKQSKLTRVARNLNTPIDNSTGAIWTVWCKLIWGAELRQAPGYLNPYFLLIRRVTAHGDEVIFTAKKTRRAIEVLKNLPLKV